MGRHPSSVSIETIRTQIQANIAHTLSDDMLELYLRGFTRRVTRQDIYTKQAVYGAIKRGKMSHEMAQMFVDYCLRNA